MFYADPRRDGCKYNRRFAREDGSLRTSKRQWPGTMNTKKREDMQTSSRMKDSNMTSKSSGMIAGTISHTSVCIAKRSYWVPSHYLTREQRDSIAIEIVDKSRVKHSQRGKHWVKHSYIHKRAEEEENASTIS